MKRCIVLGGSGTVGRAVVRELCAAGARVAFSYWRGEETAGQITKASPDVTAARIDLTDLDGLPAAVEALAKRIGGVDALVHCAVKTSTCEPARFDRIDDVALDGWEPLMRVNVTSAFVAVRALLPQFGDSGNVVLFGSVDGIKPVPSPVPYAVSKAACSGLVLSLAKALGPKGVRVNMIAPGVLEEGASRTLPDNLRAEYLKHCGLRRVGRVDEVTHLVTFLALENTYVTGQTLLVDGGL